MDDDGKACLVFQESDEVFEADDKAIRFNNQERHANVIRSQKGEKARERFTSSGYGTGSGSGSAHSAISAVASQESVEESQVHDQRQGRNLPNITTVPCHVAGFQAVNRHSPNTQENLFFRKLAAPLSQHPIISDPQLGNSAHINLPGALAILPVPVEKSRGHTVTGKLSRDGINNLPSNASTQLMLQDLNPHKLQQNQSFGDLRQRNIHNNQMVMQESSAHLQPRHSSPQNIEQTNVKSLFTSETMTHNLRPIRITQHQQSVPSTSTTCTSAQPVKELNVKQQQAPGSSNLLSPIAGNVTSLSAALRTKPVLTRQEEIVSHAVRTGETVDVFENNVNCLADGNIAGFPPHPYLHQSGISEGSSFFLPNTYLGSSILDSSLALSSLLPEAGRPSSQGRRTTRLNISKGQLVQQPNTYSGSSILDSSLTLSSLLDQSMDGCDTFLTLLETSVRCDDVNCSNDNCIKVRTHLANVQVIPLEAISGDDSRLLYAMLHHTHTPCSHSKCPFPWCGEKIDGSKKLKEHLEFLKKRIENYAEYCSLASEPVDYIKLSDGCEWDMMPQEGQDWNRLCMLGNSRKTILALTGQYPHNSYWVIKKISVANDENKVLWQLYKRLREVKNSNIAQMWWAALCDNYLLVCSQFENLTLHNCLSGQSASFSGFEFALQIMQQLMSATKHLHSLKIAYLYWISKNILVTSTTEKFHVKISNFSCSVLLDSQDQEYVPALPPAIVMPELRDNGPIGTVSDVWGLGCLLHEIVTGKPVWYEQRHLQDDVLRSELSRNPRPAIPAVFPHLQTFFSECWKVDWEKRKTVTEMEAILVEAYRLSL